MGKALAMATLLFVYAMGVWFGWMLRSDFGSRREKLIYYRYGIARGLRFWAKVVARHMRRRKEEK